MMTKDILALEEIGATVARLRERLGLERRVAGCKLLETTNDEANP